MDTVPQRLDAVRALMRAHGLSHYLVPSTDEHLNEYVPPWHQRRSWLSGFTGSAGDLLVGLAPEETWLFTDGRYHLQAERELTGSGIALERVGAAGARTLKECLGELAGAHGAACTVGYDPMVVAAATAEDLGRVLREGGASLRAVRPNLVDEGWSDRPVPPRTPLLPCPPGWTDRSVDDKVARLRRDLARRNADAVVLVKLDQIAWLTNLRSTDDIPYNPVFEAFLFADSDGAHLFLHGADERVPAAYPNEAGLRWHDYDDFVPFLRSLEKGRVWIDAAATTQGVAEALAGNPALGVVHGPSPVDAAKAVKDAAELRCLERANLMASAAKTRAFLWLRRELAADRRVTEREFRDRLEALYAGLDGYCQLSFETIAATGEHGAIIHYAGADETELRPGDLFLVDSGVQLDGGTTDDTRTVAVGPPPPEQRRLYTRVLQAHAACAAQVFPEGTPGAALDAVARAPLWADRLHYEHGTGHGVGAFLNVHEGPFSLSEARGRAAPTRGLEAGMVTSIEPGYYRAGFGGIRLEGLYRVAEVDSEVDGRRWLGFEPLTWIPFDPVLIDRDLLSDAERTWLAAYHAECLARLTPHLRPEEREELGRLLAGTGGVGGEDSPGTRRLSPAPHRTPRSG